MRTAAPRTAASADAQTELTWLIYETLRNPRAWIEVLARLQRLMTAEALVLGWHDVAIGGGACLHQVGLDPALVDRYETEFSSKNPWMQAEQLFQARAIVAGEEILPSVDLMKTEFYQEYLRPQRLLHGLCGVVCRRGSEFWHLTAARRPSRPAFDEADRRELGRLLPHIERVLELGWELAGERSARHALLDVLDQLSTAIVMVDAEARPIMVNAAAEHILGLGDGMMVHSRRLEALWHSERTRLMQLIATACAAPNGAAREGGHLKITRPSGMRPFLVIVSSLPTAYCDGAGRQRRVAAVVIKDAQAELHTSAANRREIAELYELTPAEETLLDLILDGSGLFEAAEQLGVSRNTARTHMKRIYAKTGTRRQAELVRRLAHLTSLVTPSGDAPAHPQRRRAALPP